MPAPRASSRSRPLRMHGTCGVTIHTSSQGPSFLRSEIARLLELAGEPRAHQGAVRRRRLRLQTLRQARGTGRGALVARAPAGEDRARPWRSSSIRSPSIRARFASRAAWTRTGRITARKCEVFWNGGAYADIGPRVTQKSGFVAAGPYDIENVWIDSYALYTNMTPAGALRGFGLPQLALALREPHRHDRARAQARSARFPAQEPPARRAAAGERHHLAGCPDRGGARPCL